MTGNLTSANDFQERIKRQEDLSKGTKRLMEIRTMIRLAIVDQDPADIHFLGKSERTEKTRHYVLLNWKFFKKMVFAVLSILLYKYTDPSLSCFREGEHLDEIIKIAEEETERLRSVSPYLDKPFQPAIAKRLKSAIKKTGEKSKLESAATEFCKTLDEYQEKGGGGREGEEDEEEAEEGEGEAQNVPYIQALRQPQQLLTEGAPPITYPSRHGRSSLRTQYHPPQDGNTFNAQEYDSSPPNSETMTNLNAPYNEYSTTTMPLDAQNASTHPQSYAYPPQPTDPMTSHINTESNWAITSGMQNTFVTDMGPPKNLSDLMAGNVFNSAQTSQQSTYSASANQDLPQSMGYNSAPNSREFHLPHPPASDPHMLPSSGAMIMPPSTQQQHQHPVPLRNPTRNSYKVRIKPY